MRRRPAVVCMIMLGAAAAAGDTWTVDSQSDWEANTAIVPTKPRRGKEE